MRLLRFRRPWWPSLFLLLVFGGLTVVALTEIDSAIHLAVAVLVLGGLALCALLWLLLRDRLDVDLATRTYRFREGFIGTQMSTGEGSLDEFAGVALSREWDGGDRGSWRWRLSLVQRTSGDRVVIDSSGGELYARARLEYYAKKFELFALDRSGDSEMRTAWTDLDRSLAERMAGSAEAAWVRGPPPLADGSRIELRGGRGDGWAIVLPSHWMSVGEGAAFLLGVFFVATASVMLMDRETGLMPNWPLFVIALVGGTGILCVGLGLAPLVVRKVVREERGGLTFSTDLHGLRLSRRFISRNEIEEIFIVPIRAPDGRSIGEEIVVRSDETIVRLGKRLSASDRAWLYEALRRLVLK